MAKTVTKTKSEPTKFVLASTQQKNVYIHYAPHQTKDDHAYRLKEGIDKAKVFTQKQLDEYLETLPENNGLEIIGVE